MEKEIKLSKSNLLRLKITTDTGEDTKQELLFDLEDIELSLRYQEMIERDKKNRDWLNKELLIINKRQDIKGKKLLSKNEEDKLKAYNKFFKEEVEIYNMFLGENGVQKLLNGRKVNWDTLKEIDLIIEKQIVPKLNITMDKITDKIKNKYKEAVQRNKEVLKENE